MKNLIKYGCYTLLCAVLFSSCSDEVQEGQIWVKEYNLENPYEPIERDTVIILEVVNGYAKYKRDGKQIVNNSSVCIVCSANYKNS